LKSMELYTLVKSMANNKNVSMCKYNSLTE
jgi:hypothetical protein